MKTMFLLYISSLFINGVFCAEESISVTEGDSVTLHPDLTEILTVFLKRWCFEDNPIARINENRVTYINNEKFNGRLNLSPQTGDLTITNLKSEHTGHYHIDIFSEKITTKTFSVRVGVGEVKSVSVMEKDSLTLPPDVTDIDNYDVIQWRFQKGSSPLAELNRKSPDPPKYDISDRIFKDKLKINVQTGYLTIRNIIKKHAGLYKVDISSRTHTIHKSFTVTVSDEVTPMSVKEGGSVTLHTNAEAELTEWLFLPDDSLIAKICKSSSETYGGDDEIFRNKLKLNDQTGSLTIHDIRKEHTGLYEAKISNGGRSIKRRLNVILAAWYQYPGFILLLSFVGVGVLAVVAVVSWHLSRYVNAHPGT